MNCENCIHYKLCNSLSVCHVVKVLDECRYFEDKSKYIKLPCKVGDTVYAISRGAIVPVGIDTILCNQRGLRLLGRNERFWGNGTITLDVNNVIGIEWYKSKEEAEVKLKELTKNEN